MSTKKTKHRENRLSKSDWLRHGLEALKLCGAKGLNIEALAEHIGVTKGSFYWHFKDRAEFYADLIHYWEYDFNALMIREIESLSGSADEHLKSLMELVLNEELGKYDADIRAWAVFDDLAEQAVARVDKQRMGFVRSLFEEMGFSKKESAVRSRIFYLHFIGEFSVFKDKKERSKYLSEKHKFFTSR